MLQVVKVLATMGAEQLIIEKEYGKQKVYCALQVHKHVVSGPLSPFKKNTTIVILISQLFHHERIRCSIYAVKSHSVAMSKPRVSSHVFDQQKAYAA